LGTLFSALDIGRAGMMISQVQLDITGHNIANVNKEGFSRQRVELTTRLPNYRPFGAIGRGPAIRGIERMRETFVDTIYRNQVDGLGSAAVRAGYYTRIEEIFREPSEEGFSSRLSVFFDAMHDFSNNAESLSVRVSTVTEADTVAAAFNAVAHELDTLQTNANEEVRSYIDEINSLTERIAVLNDTIQRAEFTGRKSNDLRDERDLLIDDLARIAQITARERDDGQYEILLGGDTLVYGTKRKELKAGYNPAIDPERPDMIEVQFAHNDRPVTVLGGELAGALSIRETVIPELEARIDELARGMIQHFNRIHSQANGLRNYSEPVGAANAVSDPAAAIDAAGLPFSVQDGSFDINVFDDTGALLETVTVPVTAGATSLQDIAAAIGASANMSAAISADGFLNITPEADRNISFSNDSAGALVALGMHGFFVGDDADSIAVNPDLIAAPSLLSSGYSLDQLETGDNAAALDMAMLRSAEVLENDTQTFLEYYESTIVGFGVDARANTEALQVQEAFVQDFEQRRQEVSGVNIDEEVTFLIQFQRAFEASARVISITDQMLQTVVNLVQ
jgi:flagellar hook-associated protein 1